MGLQAYDNEHGEDSAVCLADLPSPDAPNVDAGLDHRSFFASWTSSGLLEEQFNAVDPAITHRSPFPADRSTRIVCREMVAAFRTRWRRRQNGCLLIVLKACPSYAASVYMFRCCP